ncbi:MAG: transcription elongation factor GreB [Pseudohongiellaceae bacterium]
MSRYREPAKPGSAYITAEGELCLKKELQTLWSDERPRVTQSVSEAAAQGDRSENADYLYGKKRLREIDRRIRYLTKRLEVLTVVREPPADTGKVYFGATVVLQDVNGRSLQFRLVGPDEIDLRSGAVSVDSPVGQALLGKTGGSDIAITTPSGKTVYTIRSIRY